MCVIRSAPNTDEWFTTYRDAQAGETITLEPFGSKTYFVFGSQLLRKTGKIYKSIRLIKNIYTSEIEITCRQVYKNSSRSSKINFWKAVKTVGLLPRVEGKEDT